MNVYWCTWTQAHLIRKVTMLHTNDNTDPENDFDHTSTIRENYVFLVDTLDAKYSGLVGELYQGGVLSAKERDTVSYEVIPFVQNEKLLSMLSRKTKDKFDTFLDALDKTAQQHVRNKITGRQGQYCS